MWHALFVLVLMAPLDASHYAEELKEIESKAAADLMINRQINLLTTEKC